MFLRISSAIALCGLGLAGCTPAEGALPGEAVECALGKGKAFAPTCTIEREPEPGRFILHHPGGSFRRIALDPATMSVAAADGAERVTASAQEGQHIAFTLGEARYRVPLGLLAGEP